MNKRFSSKGTTFYRLFALGTTGLISFIIVRDLPQRKIGFFTILVSAVLVFSLLQTWRLKDVYADKNTLYVQGLWRKLEIPLINVSKIREPRWGKNSYGNTVIYIYLKKSSAFGHKIIFMPTWTFSYAFKAIGEHPFVDELRSLVATAKRTRQKKEI